MADQFQQEQTARKDKRSLLSGGGVAGVLTAAAIGGSEDFASGYEKTRGLLDQEEKQRADLMNRYADLELKSREISFKNMELEITQQEQDGRIAQARKFSQRAVADLDNIASYKNTDKNIAVAKAVESQLKLKDQVRNEIGVLSDGVFDEQSHQAAYRQAEQIANESGQPIETMFPGLTSDWRGTESRDAWRAAKKISASTQGARESERLQSFKHDKNMEMQEFLKESGFEQQHRAFIYDSLLQQQSMQLRLEMERLKSKPPKSWKRSDLESIKPDEVAKVLREQIGALSDEYDTFTFFEKGDEELVGIASEAAIRVSGIVDEGWSAHNKNPEIAPILQAQAITMVMEELTGRMGTDGKIYEPQSAKLKKQKQNWMSGFINIKIENNETFAALSKSEQEAYAEAVWSDPSVRRDIK